MKCSAVQLLGLAKNQTFAYDEPTGALDSKTGQKIIELLKETSAGKDVAVVMVTHNAEFEKYADKVIYLKDGKIDAIVDK